MQTRTRFTLLLLVSNFSCVLSFSYLKLKRKLSLTPRLLFPLDCARTHLTIHTAASGKVDDFWHALLTLSIYLNYFNRPHSCLKFCCFFRIDENKALINRKLLVIKWSHCLNNWPFDGKVRRSVVKLTVQYYGLLTCHTIGYQWSLI